MESLRGTGPVSTSVAGGNFAFSVADSTPDSRGQVRLSWDGDTNAIILSPTGLGNADLTAAGASGFRLAFVSTSAPTEVELTVYDDDANYSRAVRRVAGGGAQDLLIAFAEFRVAGGTGAVFSSVGAIELVLRSSEGSTILSLVETTAPSLAATKVDALVVDLDGDGRVDPGDRVRYTVTITNTGNQAQTVDFSDSIDPNTALVSGSVSSTPLAHHDQYGWFGNVTFRSDGSASRPHLLANDQDPDGDTLTIHGGTFPATSAQGGTLVLIDGATGAFSYSPPAGFSGVDSFVYAVVDGDGHSATASANIELEGVVWFVDDTNTTPPHLGTLADPFPTLASVNLVGDPDEPGDVIFVYDDDGMPYAGGHVMEADQRLLGEGVGLVLGGETIVPAGGTPQMTNAAGAGITLAVNNTIRGLDVTATSGVKIAGSNFGTLDLSTVNLTGAGGALDLDNGALSATFGTVASTSGINGIELDTVTGTFTAATSSISGVSGTGIRIANGGSTHNFGVTTIQAPIGVHLTTNTTSTFSFTSLALTSTGGAGLSATSSGTLNITGSGNTIVATGGPAVNVTSTSFGTGAAFSAVSSTGSPTTGISLDTVTGSFVANGGSITTAAGVAFDVNAGASNITYAGAITNTASRSVEITGRTGGTVTLSGNISDTGTGILVQNNSASGTPVINFSGATKALSTGANAAVTLDNNDVATINFTGGGLDINTTSGNGFNATGGAAAVTVQGSANTIATATGTALNVANTPIGAAGLTFRSISANGAINGIVLSSTGAIAGLTVTGLGSTIQGGDASGGTLQTTDDAVRLTRTGNISMTNVRIQNVGTGPADAAGGIDATDLGGTNYFRAGTITGMGSAGGSGGTNRNGITVTNTDTVLNLLSVENSVFSDSDGTSSFLITRANGSSDMTVNVSGSDFVDLVPLAVQINAGDSETGIHTVTASITDNVFRNASPADGQGGVAVVSADQGATLDFTISDNLFFDLIKGIAGGNSEIVLAQTTGGMLRGTVSGNVLGTAAFGNGDRRGIGVVSEPDVSVNGELGSVDVVIDGNIIDRLTDREAIFVDLREDTQDSELIIRNNVIGQLVGFEGQVGGIREAVDVQSRGEVTRTVRLQVADNDIRTISTVSAVNLEVNIDNASSGNLTMHATVTGNTIRNTGIGTELIARPRDPGAVTTLCLDMAGNSIDGGAGTIDLNETGVLNVEQSSVAALAAANGILVGNVLVSGTAPTFDIACAPPPQ